MSWELKRLGDFVNIKTGKLDANASSIHGSYPFFTCSREPLQISSYSYDCECVLIAGNGDLNVKYYFGKFDAYQRTYVIESKDKSVLWVRYLYFFLDKYLEKLREQSIGGVIKYIKLENITDAQIPIPPLETQIRIADILDAADALRQKDQELLKKYDNLAQAIFIDMFGDPVKNEKGWEVKLFDEFIEYIGDIGSNGSNEVISKNLKMLDVEDYAIMVRTTNLANDDFAKNIKYVSQETYNFFKKSKVFGGEIIMNKIGSAGDFWIMPNLNKPVSLGLNQLVIRLKNLNTKYLFHYLSTPFGKHIIKSSVNGAVTKSITKGAVKNLSIIYPSILLQEKFEKRINQVESLRKNLTEASNKSEKNFHSILQNAFNGELV